MWSLAVQPNGAVCGTGGIGERVDPEAFPGLAAHAACTSLKPQRARPRDSTDRGPVVAPLVQFRRITASRVFEDYTCVHTPHRLASSRCTLVCAHTPTKRSTYLRPGSPAHRITPCPSTLPLSARSTAVSYSCSARQPVVGGTAVGGATLPRAARRGALQIDACTRWNGGWHPARAGGRGPPQ